MKKGFTLVELLAVIIIIGIIALITVPIVLSVIGSSKQKALQNSAYGLIESGKIYYSNSLLKPDVYQIPKTFIGPDYDDLQFNGKKYEGKLIVENDKKIAVAVYDEGWCAYKLKADSYVNLEEVGTSSDCINKIASEETGSSSISCTSTSGTVSYALGTSYTCDPGDGSRTFYVLEEGTDTVSLIMNENLGDRVAWITQEDYEAAGGTQWSSNTDRNSFGPITANNYLEEQTSSWTVDVSLPAGQQIADAVGNTSWPSGGSYISLSSAPWLYDNLYASSNTPLPYGYWTSTPSSGYSNYAWSVNHYGNLSINLVDNDTLGVRPVITVSKSQLSQ